MKARASLLLLPWALAGCALFSPAEEEPPVEEPEVGVVSESPFDPSQVVSDEEPASREPDEPTAPAQAEPPQDGAAAATNPPPEPVEEGESTWREVVDLLLDALIVALLSIPLAFLVLAFARRPVPTAIATVAVLLIASALVLELT